MESGGSWGVGGTLRGAHVSGVDSWREAWFHTLELPNYRLFTPTGEATRVGASHLPPTHMGVCVWSVWGVSGVCVVCVQYVCSMCMIVYMCVEVYACERLV